MLPLSSPFSSLMKFAQFFMRRSLYFDIMKTLHFNTLKKIYSLLKKYIYIISYKLISSITKKDKIVLYSSKNDKFGNISALANKFSEMGIEFLHIYHEQFKRYSFSSLIFLSRARVLVIDASSPAARMKLHRNTCLIHCWHACGAYKKIGFDARRKGYNDISEEIRIKRIHRGISWFVCTSQETAKVYSKAFRLPEEKMLVLGSPRLDVFLKKKNYPEPSMYTILYAPTFRTQNKNVRYLPPLPDAKILRQELAFRLGENICFAFRGHPTVPVHDDLKGWEDWSNIPQQEALCRTSVLITDYSSVFFDFLPLHRPIIFYVPDFKEYLSHERDLYFSPYDAFPETTCSNMNSLIKIIALCRHMKVDYGDIWEKYLSACDGNATERLCNFIINIFQQEKIK